MSCDGSLKSISLTFHTRFSYKILAPKTTKLALGFEILAPKTSYKNRAHKTLMKLTPHIHSFERSSDSEVPSEI